MFQKILNKVGLYTRSQVARRNAGFAAAAINRLTADWTLSTLSSDSELRSDLPKLRPRIRKLKNDNDYAQKFLAMCKSNILGENGINFRNKAKDPDTVQGGRLVTGKMDVFANKRIEDAWWEWGKRENCTVTKRQTWKTVQELIVEEVFTVGEVLIRKVKGFDNRFKFAVQLIETDHLDIELNRVPDKNGHEIRMGVEFNAWKQPVAYHLLRSHPYDNFYASQIGSKYQRVPASEMVHLFLPRRIGQSRGYPPMATAMSRLNMLGGYEEAEVTAARVAACKMGIIQTKGDQAYEGPKDPNGNPMMEMSPGSVPQLDVGLEWKDVNPTHPNTAYAAFVKGVLRGAASGLGHVSYNTFANDMESVNFASGKLGLEEERQGWKVFQVWLWENCHDEIFPDWLEASLLTGVVPLPMSKFDKFNAPCWSGRTWDFIDPTKEVAEIREMLRLGLTSHSRELAKLGIDRDELWQEREEDMKAAEAHKLTFPDLEPEQKALSIEEETLKFKQQAYLGFQKDGTVGDVMANLTDLSALTDEVGIPREKSQEAEPWLPVIADNGQPVTGEVVKDSEGDIVGGEAEAAPDPIEIEEAKAKLRPKPSVAGGGGGGGAKSVAISAAPDDSDPPDPLKESVKPTQTRKQHNAQQNEAPVESPAVAINHAKDRTANRGEKK